MTPKEKAEYLLELFEYELIEQKKQYALKIVDEIIYYLEIVLGVDKCDFEYWYEVQQEIEKL